VRPSTPTDPPRDAKAQSDCARPRHVRTFSNWLRARSARTRPARSGHTARAHSGHSGSHSPLRRRYIRSCRPELMAFHEVASVRAKVCHPAGMSLDPVVSKPGSLQDPLRERTGRVLEYTDRPGDRTTPHQHPDSVMYTLSTFRRRLASEEVHRDVELKAGSVGWLPAQQHHGENIGDTPTHALFVELKETAPDGGGSPAGN
jgi:quercetin dioxygenase-like cupin family protein